MGAGSTGGIVQDPMPRLCFQASRDVPSLIVTRTGHKRDLKLKFLQSCAQVLHLPARRAYRVPARNLLLFDMTA